MYKLIAIDLDGTLLNSYGEITKENREAIRKVIENGAKVVLTSGRTSSAIENFASETGANEYMISGNGAAIYDFQNHKTIYNQYLTKEKVLEIIKVCEENSMYYNVYTERSVITKTLNYNTLYYHSENQKKPEEKQTKIDIVENIPNYINKLDDKNFLKITVCDKDDSIFKGIITTLKKDKNIDVLDVSHMSRKVIRYGTEELQIEYYYTEITNKNVNKWNALEFLMKQYEIKPEEVMTIGDNMNDIEMIQNAGLGVAMGNSSPRVKEIADVVTLSNDENGVAEVLKKYW